MPKTKLRQKIEKRGAFHVPRVYFDADSNPIVLTPNRVKHFQMQLAHMARRGLVVPVVKEHQDWAKPMRKGDPRLKKAFGTLEEIRMDRNGAVSFVVKPHRMSGKGKNWPSKTSAEIMPEWRDGTTRYADAVTHLALTDQPVASEQDDVWHVDQRMSLHPGVIRMSLTGSWRGSKVNQEYLKYAQRMADDKDDDDDEATEQIGRAHV